MTSDLIKNIAIIALTNILILIGGIGAGYYFANKTEHKHDCHCSTESVQGIFGRKFQPIHAVLFHVVASDLKGTTPRATLIDKLLDDDKFSDAAVNAVIKYAGDHNADLNKMTPKEIFKWIWDHREDIINILVKLLPLFIHDTGAIGAAS